MSTIAKNSDFSRHVPLADINRLSLGQLSTFQSLCVQRHLFKCKDCLRTLIEMEVQLTLVEGGEGGHVLTYYTRKPLVIIHDTADGMIYSRAERRGRKWFAAHWGKQLAGERECATMRDANEFLVRSIGEMFPEHRCTSRCYVNAGQEFRSHIVRYMRKQDNPSILEAVILGYQRQVENLTSAMADLQKRVR